MAFGVLGTTELVGAHPVQEVNALDSLWNFIGFHVSKNLVLRAITDAVIANGSVAASVIALIVARRYDEFSVKPFTSNAITIPF